jgi:murein DD-endopeptidase
MRPFPIKRLIHWLVPGFLSLCAVAMAQDRPTPGLRQSFDLSVPQAPTPVPLQGKAQLTYELHFTNFSDDALAVKRVRVVDPAGKILADFAGDALGQRLTLVSGKGPIAPGQRAVLFVETDVPLTAVPGVLRHIVDYGMAGGNATFTTESPALKVESAPPVMLGPPLAGGPWAAVHDPSWPRGHRRVFYTIDGRARLPGRYAIDFIRLDSQGHTTAGDTDRTSDAFGYGDNVLAVADGVIVGVRNDMAESAQISRNPAHPLGEGAGNYVALRLQGGQIAFYEHLRPDSVRVRAGERVRRGQVIGALGFTGDTTGPHLHFHLAKTNSLLGAEGIPFVFDHFTLLGRIDDMAQFGKGPWHATKDVAPERRREWPGFNTVLSFDAGESLSPATTRH